MDQLMHYRSSIQTILNQYYRMTISQSASSEGSEVSDRHFQLEAAQSVLKTLEFRSPDRFASRGDRIPAPIDSLGFLTLEFQP